MKFAMAEKFHEKYIEDVVKEISEDSLWRRRLFGGQYDEQFLITFNELEELPCGLWTVFSKYGLEFLVSKIHSCPEKFEEGLVIFKFEAKGFSHVVSYSGSELVQLKLNIGASDGDSTPPEAR